jgi:transposase-like protein
MHQHASEDTLERDRLLAEIRATRFADGLRCVHCFADAVNRWGWFDGRQRYRCRKCKRTFSDLTRTAAAYTKHIERWPIYEACMAEALSVRASAAQTGIHRTTSFRWRHAILRVLRSAEEISLTGVVEIVDKRFAYSKKGQLNRKRPPERLPSITWKRWLGGRRVNVTVACTPEQTTYSLVTGGRKPRFEEVWTHIVPCLRSAKCVISLDRRLGTYARIARQAKLVYQPARRKRTDESGHYKVENARRYVGRLMAWLERFHGVATSYLDHYLLWHRQTDNLSAAAAEAAMRCGRGMPPTMRLCMST